MLASRPSCVADSSVNPNRTVAAAYCHLTVRLGRAMEDGMTVNATLQGQKEYSYIDVDSLADVYNCILPTHCVA